VKGEKNNVLFAMHFAVLSFLALVRNMLGGKH
jgi:hypothetical protein